MDERVTTKFARVRLSSNLDLLVYFHTAIRSSNSQSVRSRLFASDTLSVYVYSPFSLPAIVKLREAEERARNAFGAMEAKFTDRIAGVETKETTRIEAIELALREQGDNLKEAIEADHRLNKRRSDETHADVKSLEGRLRSIIADAQEEESARVGSLLQQAQEQVQAEHCCRTRYLSHQGASVLYLWMAELHVGKRVARAA